MSTEHLHFSTQMLSRLGEELNPHPDQGILELVRNAYDADADECVVELLNTQQAGGTVRVSDDGVGLTAEEIRRGWLILGSSGKEDVRKTDKKRVPIGNKGIGRLAALRLGRAATLTTRPEGEPTLEHRIVIDWTVFDSAKVVEEVALELQTVGRAANAGRGTIVEINKLRDSLTKPDVKRLARALVLLADPFRDAGGGVTNFRPVLRTPEFEDLERLVVGGYREEADYKLRAELDSKGRATAFVKDYAGEEVFRGSHNDICSEKAHPSYLAPAATFDLWWFVLNPSGFSPRSVTLAEVKEWLKEFGGVHLYHRGMRVSPYSDIDWLDMNLRRVRSPELRPSTNTSIGRLAVLDPRGRLQPKTDRVGFVEEEAFNDLRRFATDVLDWFAAQMLKRREEQRGGQKERTKKKLRRAQKNLDDAVADIPPNAQGKVQQAIDEYEKAKDQEANTLRSDLQLYRTLGTVGATAAAFAHQSKSPLAHIVSSAKTLEEVATDSNLFKAQAVGKVAGGIRRNAESLLAFAKVTLGLLQHEKRRRGDVPVHVSVNEIIALLQPYLDLRKAKIEPELQAEEDTILASKAAVESILTNLVINSLQAFERKSPGDRTIVIRTRNVKDKAQKGKQFLQLMVLDNGPGITGTDVEEIWLPGKTTTAEGTGLGLTIVKDVVTELGGQVRAVAHGELGGAEFLIQLPVRAGGQT